MIISGNVGIGTTGPGQKLEVAAGNIRIAGTDQTNARLQINNSGASGREYAIVSGIPNVGQVGLSFFDITANATRMVIDSTGNVGIGTTNPLFKLEVAGTASTTALNVVGNINNATLTASSLVMSDAGKNLSSVSLGSGLTLNGSTLNTTQAGGAWTIGSGLIYNATSTDLVGIGTITPTTTLFVQGKGGTNPFAIASSTGSTLLTVTQSGNVGVGTSTPTNKLHVVGDVRINSNDAR